MEIIGKVDRALAKIEEVLLALLLVGMVVLAGVQVLLRNVWNTAIDWADISLQNVTVIVALLGAAIATSEGRHLNIDLLSRAFKAGRAKIGLRTVIGFFAVYVCWQLALGGWATFQANYRPWLTTVPEGWSAMKLLRQEVSEGTFPQWLSQLPLAGGFALIGVHFLLRLVRDLGSLASGNDWIRIEDAGLQGDAMLDELEAHAGDDDDDAGEKKSSGDNSDDAEDKDKGGSK